MSTAQKIIKYFAIAFAIVLIVGIISGIAGMASSFSFLFDEKDAVGGLKTYAVNEEVLNLEVALRGAQLEIRDGDTFSVESNYKYLDVENVDGLLGIKEKRQIFGFHSNHVKVILTIPENFQFDKAEISTGAGTVKIDTLQSEKLYLDLGAGEVIIDYLVANTNAKIDGGVGEFTVNDGTLTDLKFDMGIGEANLTSALMGDCEIDYGVGETNLTLLGSEADYGISLDKGLGEATLDGVKMADETVYGNGNHSIEIDGGVGELRIQFKN